LPSRQRKPTISDYIIDLVKATNPETVEQLITQIQLKYPTSKQEIMNHIINLQNQGKLVFKNPPASIPFTLKNYLLSTQAQWYWLVIALSAITTILVFTVAEDVYPIVYARYLFGSIFVLFLPGYSLIKALFPTKVPIPTPTKELDNIERIALSIGMSLALVPLVGLLLNYTPWGIRLTPITISLLALTLTLSTAAIIREHQTKTEKSLST